MLTEERNRGEIRCSAQRSAAWVRKLTRKITSYIKVRTRERILHFSSFFQLFFSLCDATRWNNDALTFLRLSARLHSRESENNDLLKRKRKKKGFIEQLKGAPMSSMCSHHHVTQICSLLCPNLYSLFMKFYRIYAHVSVYCSIYFVVTRIVYNTLTRDLSLMRWIISEILSSNDIPTIELPKDENWSMLNVISCAQTGLRTIDLSIFNLQIDPVSDLHDPSVGYQLVASIQY